MKKVIRNYDYIYIENFHRFKEPVKFQIRPFTIFLGPNGSGKSALSLAIKLFIDSVKVIFQDKETRTNFFKKKEYYSLLLSDDDKFVLRKEYSEAKKYVEFTYKKNQDFIDIYSFEYGNLDGEFKKNKLFSFNTEFPKSKYLQELTKDDYVDKWLKINLPRVWDDLELKDILSEFDNVLRNTVSYNSSNYIGFITFISPELIKDDYDFYDSNTDLNMIRYLLFREDSFHFSPEDNDNFEIRVDPLEDEERNKDDKKRNPNIIDYFVNEFGFQQLNKFSIFDLIRHLFVSFQVRQDLEKELVGFLIDEADSLHYKFLDEVRLEPPDFLEVKNNIIINDYYGVYDILKNIKGGKKINFLKDLKTFEIADNVKLNKIGFRKPNVDFYEIIFTSNGYKFPIKNLSSGGKQFFPILLLLYFDFDSDDTYRWLFLKQPELHLHPRLQMQIPELLLKRNIPLGYIEYKKDDPIITVHLDIKMFYNFFIIETHSEHIIRKFQLLVASSKYPDFTNEDISIIYVKPDKSDLTSSIKIMELDEKGNFIDNWPAGFFDESAELSYALLEAQIKRKN